MKAYLFEALRYVDIVAMSACGLRLFASGLYRIYWPLAAHVVVAVTLAILSLAFPARSSGYVWVFLTDSVLRWLFWILIVGSLAGRALTPVPALGILGRWALGIGVSFTLVVILLTTGIDDQYTYANVFLSLAYVAERTVSAMLALFLLTLLALLAWFSVPLSRNCMLLCVGFGLIFSLSSITNLLAYGFGPEIFRTLNIPLLLATSGVFFAWAMTLNRRGEDITTYLGRRPTEAEVEAAIRRLKSVSDKVNEDESEKKRA